MNRDVSLDLTPVSEPPDVNEEACYNQLFTCHKLFDLLYTII